MAVFVWCIRDGGMEEGVDRAGLEMRLWRGRSEGSESMRKGELNSSLYSWVTESEEEVMSTNSAWPCIDVLQFILGVRNDYV